MRSPLARHVPLASLLIPILLCSSPERTAGEPIAGQLSRENIESRRVGGPDADAGVGDWFLGNGTICAAISDPSHESPLAPQGGVLIDLGLCGAHHDQWTVLQPLLNLSQSHVVPVTGIEAGRDDASAWIRTRAIFAGVEIVTTYSVDDIMPRALKLETRARRVDEGDALFSIGSVLLHPGGQTRPFSLVQRDPTRSRGFVYPDSDHRSPLSLLRALSASDLQVLVGADEMPGVSYGVERISARLRLTQDDESAPALGSFSVTGEDFTMLSSLTRPFWLGDPNQPPGILQFAQLPFMDLEAGEVLESEARIRVGHRADVASITDQLWSGAPLVRGVIDDPRARIHIDSADGAPVTEIRPEPNGQFSARLPPGRYVARARSDADRHAAQRFEVVEGRGDQKIAPLVLGPPASVKLPDAFVGRLIFLPEDASEPAVFGEDHLGFRVGDESIPSGTEAPFVSLSGSPHDPERITLAPGRYRVLALRGPEYEMRESRLTVRTEHEAELALEALERVRPTPGWIAADLHVHSGQSFDSSLPAARQVIAFAASGTEILVATEHDRIFDPRPVILSTGLNDALVSITGVEMTSTFEGGDSPHSSGHLNAFPFSRDPNAYRGGAPSLEGRRLRDALADVRASEPGSFIQLNHPRAGPDEEKGDTFFVHLGVAGVPFEPTTPLARFPNAALLEANPVHGLRDLDFHGLELLNSPSLVRYRRVRADWLSLLLQGESRVATASSDSHRLGVIVGLPRTYVAASDDRLVAFDETDFIAALRAGRAYGTTGPLLEMRLGETSIGGLHRGDRGVLELSVEAADWIPIEEWRVYVNGELVYRAPLAAGETAQLPLAFDADAFVTVEVQGPVEGRYAAALPGFVPFAFTNPIFVDADGNGRFEAPGLPVRLPPTLSHPEQPD